MFVMHMRDLLLQSATYERECVRRRTHIKPHLRKMSQFINGGMDFNIHSLW